MLNPIIMTMSKEARKGIAAGKLFRSGAVVRYVENGRIFEHLVEATLSQHLKRGLKAASVIALQYVKLSPIGLLIAALVTILFVVLRKILKGRAKKKVEAIQDNVFDLNEYRRQKEESKEQNERRFG